MSHLKAFAASAGIAVALTGCSSTSPKPAPTTTTSSATTHATATPTQSPSISTGAGESQIKTLHATQVDSLTHGMPTDTRLWVHTGTAKPAIFPLPGNSRVTIKFSCHASDLQIQMTGEKKTVVQCSPDGALTVLLPATGSKNRSLTVNPSANNSVWSVAAWRGILTQ